MNIVQLNSSDLGGGAELVASTLHREYLQRRHHSTLIVGAARTGEPQVLQLDNDSARNPWARAWRRAGEALAPFDGRIAGAGRLRRTIPLAIGQPRRWWKVRRGEEDFDFPATRLITDLAATTTDVVHAHNLHGAWTADGGYFDLRELPALSHAVPFFLTLHDAWLLSGHCAHSFACDRWMTGCGSCPDLSIYPSIPRDATAFNWRRKHTIYSDSKLHVATPSRWLMNKVERSMLAASVVEARVIPNGIDTAVFRPGDSAAARRTLGLPANATIVMLAANALLESEWKDVPLMRSVLGGLGGEPLLVVAVGDAPREEHVGSTVVRFVPSREHDALAELYRAADVYVHPARAETFGLVLAEAMACGTPVVSTEVGGIPEIVTSGETGLLVAPGDTRAFTTALRTLAEDGDRRAAMGAAAAADVPRRFGQEHMVDAYLDWYQAVLEP